MNSEVAIKAALSAQGIGLANAIVADELPDGKHFVFIDVIRNADNHQVPSNLKLREVQELLRRENILVEFILIDAFTKDIESGARANLLHAFGDRIRNAFLAVERKQAFLWLVPKRQLSVEDLQSINLRLSHYLNAFELNLVETKITAFENLPTKTAILRRIRLKAPVEQGALENYFVAKNFLIPSASWFGHQLDGLRREGAIVRLKSGHYAMSLSSLQAMGTLKNRRSPDIERLLDLARRD